MAARASGNIPPSLRKIWEDQEKYGRNFTGNMTPKTTKAIVSYGPWRDGGWRLDEVAMRPPETGELLVEMVASGVCHTDAMIGGLAEGSGPLASYPRILGHEGSGYVRAIGPGVTVAQVGDPVLLSFDFCETCEICRAGHYSNCPASSDLNFGIHRVFQPLPVSSDAEQASISGQFFGQSSFAQFSIVRQTSVTNVAHLIKDKEELKLLAPLGCGIQTGSGTVVNVSGAGPEDAICILGLGGVGLSAVMGAKITGCRIIIGVDRVQSRIQLAKELGATHVIDGSDLPDGKSLKDVIQDIADKCGPTITIDTTGASVLMETGMDVTRNRGKYIQVGAPPMDYHLSKVNVFQFMMTGKQYIGAIEGGSYPREYIPRMIQWYREGRFPIDKLIKMMPAEDFKQALQQMHDGTTVKPVITW